MGNVDTENDTLLKGIKQILGIEDYPEPEKVGEFCNHESDSYIYNNDVPESLVYLLQCKWCGIQYEIPK
jgi:hypothetical protein